jgi:hypothetical protein
VAPDLRNAEEIATIAVRATNPTLHHRAWPSSGINGSIRKG